jgi:hypothetical protein
LGYEEEEFGGVGKRRASSTEARISQNWDVCPCLVSADVAAR